MIRSSRSRLLPLALLALACIAAPARAGFSTQVVETNARQADGLYLYTYAVLNTGGTGATPITEFDVAVNDPAGLSMISSPGDFLTFYAPGDSLISFIATDAGIAAGSAGIFSFESASSPGQVADQVLGFDSGSSAVSFSQGTIVGAAVIAPEPSSILMLGLGSVGVLGMLARSRSRARAAA